MARRWMLVAAIVLVVAAGIAVSVRLAAGSCPDGDAGGNAAGPVSTSTESAEEYWTAERKASAQPVRQPDPGEDRVNGC